jgi:hypothetical protein
MVARTKSHEIPVAVDGTVKTKALFTLGGNYLENLLYFYFGMQLGINLCTAINVQATFSVMRKDHLKDVA